MSHHSLTPAEAERLEMLAEEAGEIVQAVTKILRHGYDSFDPTVGFYRTNRAHLMEELQELQVVQSQMKEQGDLFGAPIRDDAEIWRRKLAYTHHQNLDPATFRAWAEANALEASL